MKKTYKTALGQTVDIDSLRLANENVVAIGNMKVNARGDELGPGGEVIRTRNEVMADYYSLHGAVVNKTEVPDINETQAIKNAQIAAEQKNAASKLRGAAARRILEDQDGVEL